MEPIPEAPAWFEGFKWIVAGLMLAAAAVGPVIFGPIIDKMKGRTAPASQQSTEKTFALIGETIAERDAMIKLTEAIHRLCDILEENAEVRREESAEVKMRRFIHEAMLELMKQDSSKK